MDENWIKTTSDVLQTISFGAHCVWNDFFADTEFSNVSELQEMSDWDQSNGLDLLQTKSCK